jgi:hypothetical protein
MPFFSSRSRVEKIIGTVGACRGFRRREVPLEEFRTRWLDNLERDGLMIGVNWTGKRALGYDVAPAVVRCWFNAAT